MMLSQQTDPIAAIATAPGRGAIGIVRLSGKKLSPFIETFCKKTLRPREASYLQFTDADGTVIDHGIAIYFEGPHSYTGEDVFELQAHGGPVVLQMLLKRCLQLAEETRQKSGKQLLPRLRIAQPGEFSQRAFLNSKMDLAQAEAIADLIDASTEAAAISASRSLAGEFSREIQALKHELIHLRTLVEATLDFPEEEIDFLEKADADGQLNQLLSKLKQVQQRAKQGQLLREGIKVVIAGQPNSGKSSLLNALAGAELAIVTPVEGTTRDKIQQTIQIEGVPLHIIDTAGLRIGENEVEKIGIERSWDEIKGADVILFLHDLTRGEDTKYQQLEEDIYERLIKITPKKIAILDVWNKLDVCKIRQMKKGVSLSAKTGEGLMDLQKELLNLAGWQLAPEGVFVARERHMAALAMMAENLKAARAKMLDKPPQLELMAEELRLAQEGLNQITGEFTNEDLLGEIFSSFCIGK